jgi:hypothetical protein
VNFEYASIIRIRNFINPCSGVSSALKMVADASLMKAHLQRQNR